MPINVSYCTIHALTIVLEQRIDMSEGSESATGNVHLLVADISNLLANPALQTEALQHLSSYRREKVEACGNPRNRALSIGVALLLDGLLSEHGLHECEMTYVEGEHGKPSFANHPELLFNLSHSGSLVAAAMLKNANATTCQRGRLAASDALPTRYRAPYVLRRRPSSLGHSHRRSGARTSLRSMLVPCRGIRQSYGHWTTMAFPRATSWSRAQGLLSGR